MNAENQNTAKKTTGTDVTPYAKECGYKGEKPVIVLDGRVVSHRSVLWERFIQKVKAGRI